MVKRKLLIIELYIAFLGDFYLQNIKFTTVTINNFNITNYNQGAMYCLGQDVSREREGDMLRGLQREREREKEKEAETATNDL